jgi:hypothetical protein
MNSPSPPQPHPLAAELIVRLASVPDAAVIDAGAGSGRNSLALRRAGFYVEEIPDDELARIASLAPARFDAAISTHALLHGFPHDIASRLEAIASALKTGAPLYATFASCGDARYGQGSQLGSRTFAPDSGEERGVPHTYFDEASLQAQLASRFVLESMDERNVDDLVGRWAHRVRPTRSVHWFVRVRKR